MALHVCASPLRRLLPLLLVLLLLLANSSQSLPAAATLDSASTNSSSSSSSLWRRTRATPYLFADDVEGGGGVQFSLMRQLVYTQGQVLDPFEESVAYLDFGPLKYRFPPSPYDNSAVVSSSYAVFPPPPTTLCTRGTPPSLPASRLL